MKILTLLAILLVPSVGQAQTVSCQGVAPNWSLEFNQNTARFTLSAVTEMNVMLTTTAEGQDWPRAFTLVGDLDTAIAVIEQETCQAFAHRGHILTQRGETPILLTGCCTVSESPSK